MTIQLSSNWLRVTLVIATLGTAVRVKTPCCADEPIVLGAVYNTSGRQAGLDVPSSQGALLAVAEANRNGGVLGRRIVLQMKDGQSEKDVVRVRTTELLDSTPAPVALFGLSDTDLLLAAAPLAASNKRVFLTSGATSPLLPAQVPEYLFLACFGDNAQASAAAEWAHTDCSARTAVVLFDSSQTYTKLLHGYFQERFKQLGGEIAAEPGFTSATLEESIDDVPHADVVYLAAEDPHDIRKAIRLLREEGLSCPIIGGDSFDSEGLWQQSTDVNDVYFTTHAYLGEDNLNPRVVAFRKLYSEAYPASAPDAFAALGYDAARLLLDAITRAQSAEPDDVRRALAGTQQFEGVTGTIRYSDGSRIPSKPVSLLGVRKGKVYLVREIQPKIVPPPD